MTTTANICNIITLRLDEGHLTFGNVTENTVKVFADLGDLLLCLQAYYLSVTLGNPLASVVVIAIEKAELSFDT